MSEQEKVASAIRDYHAAAEPVIKAIARLVAMEVPKVIISPEGYERKYSPEIQISIDHAQQYLSILAKSIAKSYGLEMVKP